MKKQFIALMAIISIAFAAAGRQPQRGYRGFAEWSNSIREDTWIGGETTTSFYTGLSTSHGYQFNPWLFVGAGLDYEHCSRISSSILATFLQGRTDLVFGRFTPFGDVRIGYNMAQGGGIYFSPSIGYRFNWGRKAGVNLGIGLTLQGYSADIYEIGVSPDGFWIQDKIGTHHGSAAFFSFRLGFDF